MRVLVYFVSFQAQWKYKGTRRGHILLSRPRHSPVFIPANGTRDTALCRLFGQHFCFSLSSVTGSRLRWLALSLSLHPVWMGRGCSVVGVCISLKWGPSPSFIPCPLVTAPVAHSTQRKPSQRFDLSREPLLPGGKFIFPPGSGKLSK